MENFIAIIFNEVRKIVGEEIDKRSTSSNVDNNPKNEPPVSQQEICTFLNITEPTIIRWRKKGKIPFMKIGSRILYQKSVVIAALSMDKKGGKSK